MNTLELPVLDTEELPVVDEAPLRPGPSAPMTRRAWGPRDRPPLASRLFVGFVAFGAALTTMALLLSDRAPGALESIFGERARRLWERIDASGRVDLPQERDLPPADFFVHVGIWAVMATLIGLTIWSWRGLLIGAVLLVISSVTLELAQGRYSTTRQVEFRDGVANVGGIVCGLVVAAASYLAWSGVAGVARRLRAR